MKTKTEQLNDLFNKWEANYEPYKGKFTRDGINNEDLFDKMKSEDKGVLFITKDPNDPEQWGGDFRTWWKEKLWGQFSIRIGQWAYGFTNDFPPFNEAVKNALQGTHAIAFMNLKKIGGAANANKKSILKIVEETSGFLKQEISIIDPDIIVGGGLYHEAWRILFGELKWLDSGFGIRISKWENSKIINYYHPSSRFKKEDTYKQLENVVNSAAFKNL